MIIAMATFASRISGSGSVTEILHSMLAYRNKFSANFRGEPNEKWWCWNLIEVARFLGLVLNNETRRHYLQHWLAQFRRYSNLLISFIHLRFRIWRTLCFIKENIFWHIQDFISINSLASEMMRIFLKEVKLWSKKGWRICRKVRTGCYWNNIYWRSHGTARYV